MHRRLVWMLLSGFGVALGTPVLGAAGNETPGAGTDAPAPTAIPSQNVTVNLINRLVERGVLSSEDSRDLLMLAEADAAEARAQAAMTQAALAQAEAAQARARALSLQLARKNSGSGVALDSGAQARVVLPQAPVAVESRNSVAPLVQEAPAPSFQPRLEAPVRTSQAITAVPLSAPIQTENPAVKIHRVIPRENGAVDVVDVSATASPAATNSPAARAEVEAQKETVETPEVPVALAERKQPVRRPEPAEELPQAAPADDEPVSEDTVRVSYIPEVVRNQIRDEIKQEVMDQARAENWASPRTLPDWILRFRLFGDLRVRGEGLFYRAGNVSGYGSAYWNYAAINSGAPYDSTGASNPPYLNVDENRNRARFRARLGAAADLGESFSAGLRIATGESNSPVTQNQSFGGAGSGQGGNFSKYALWLDRAFLSYEIGGLPDKDFVFNAGRFDNPFMSTSMVWADDLGFDGFAAKGKLGVGEGVTGFFSAGAFPVFNTDLNFGTNQPNKFKSYDKWLYAAQLGTDMEITNDVNFKLGAAFYLFKNIEGRISTPYTPVTSADNGDTDASRPAFAQKGNSYVALRNIEANTLNNNGTINQWQYFGLATPFRVLAVDSRLDLNFFEPFQISLIGEYAKNLGFDKARINANGPTALKGAVNNNASDGTTFLGSDSGWNASLRFGAVALEKRWDWNASLGYRRVGSDAVVDGFADSDFGGGGTNVKGFTFTGNLAVAKNVWLGLRWMSATEVIGPKFKNDTLQIDLNGKF